MLVVSDNQTVLSQYLMGVQPIQPVIAEICYFSSLFSMPKQ